MSTWHRFHQDQTIKAMATSDNNRFIVSVREPPDENRNPLTFYRWNLRDAQEAADRVVQAYYPHDCSDEICDVWRKSES